ncbi:MAG: hypothetical protein P8Z71_07400 [Candidatus Sulfobium sp.]|jgi:hypothetical protein
MKKLRRIFQLWVLVGLAVIAATPEVARAVPSFARQTGLSCFTCHTVYPELTPFGRDFKLRGYVFSRSKGPFQFPPPLAGMIMASLTHTDTRVPQGYFTDEWSNRIMSGGNDVLTIPEEANLYYAGRIFGHLGAFIQGAYEGDTNSFHLDMTDIRFAGSTSLEGKELVYGITVNNSPTVQDLWNTTPSWGYPFESSEVAPAPAAASIIDGTLDQQVGGIGVYGLWNQLVYAEFTVYHTTKGSIAHPLGAGTNTDMVVDNYAPYWRLALQHLWGEHYLSVGTYGMTASIFPDSRDSGPTDRFTDFAFDAEYQYLKRKYSLSAETTWIHEKQNWDASYAMGNAENKSDTLKIFKFNVDYYYQASFGRIGGSAAYFSTTGSSDALLYSPGSVDGSRNGSPDSNGFILEADYLPLDKVRLNFQYTIYNKFNGASSNYDGSGRSASDNNTLYLAATLML